MLGPFIFKKTTILLCLLGEKQNDTAYALTKNIANYTIHNVLTSIPHCIWTFLLNEMS